MKEENTRDETMEQRFDTFLDSMKTQRVGGAFNEDTPITFANEQEDLERYKELSYDLYLAFIRSEISKAKQETWDKAIAVGIVVDGITRYPRIKWIVEQPAPS